MRRICVVQVPFQLGQLAECGAVWVRLARKERISEEARMTWKEGGLYIMIRVSVYPPYLTLGVMIQSILAYRQIVVDIEPGIRLIISRLHPLNRFKGGPASKMHPTLCDARFVN